MDVKVVLSQLVVRPLLLALVLTWRMNSLLLLNSSVETKSNSPVVLQLMQKLLRIFLTLMHACRNVMLRTTKHAWEAA